MKGYKDLITEARELCSKATPALWQVKLHNEDYGQGYGEMTNFVDMGGTLLKIGIADTAEKYTEYSTFSTFIARSRVLISELCDALEKYHWIPVTEGLPEERQYENGEPIEFNVIISGAKVPTTLCFDGVEWRDFWKEGGYGPAYAVTHWMPLPAPPEKGAKK